MTDIPPVARRMDAELERRQREKLQEVWEQGDRINEFCHMLLKKVSADMERSRLRKRFRGYAVRGIAASQTTR